MKTLKKIIAATALMSLLMSQVQAQAIEDSNFDDEECEAYCDSEKCSNLSLLWPVAGVVAIGVIIAASTRTGGHHHHKSSKCISTCSTHHHHHHRSPYYYAPYYYGYNSHFSSFLISRQRR